MITLAIAVAFFYFVRQNYDLFNGFNGYAGVQPPTLLGIYWRDPAPFYYLSLAVAAFFLFAVVYGARSPFGLSLARKSVVSGKSVSVRLCLGGCRYIKKKKH